MPDHYPAASRRALFEFGRWWLNRPTKEVGVKDHPWYDGGGRHWSYIVAWGRVAAQFELRLWRVTFGLTLWRSYDPE